MNTIRRDATGDAHVIFGAACDDSLGDQLRVTVIATGSSRALLQAGGTDRSHRCSAAADQATTSPTPKRPVARATAAAGIGRANR